MKLYINTYLLYVLKNSENNTENRKIELRDERDGMKDNRRIVRNSKFL